MGGGVNYFAVPCFARAGLDRPFATGEINEQLPSGGRPLAHCGHRSRAAAAAGGHAVIGHKGRVRHNQLQTAGGHAQFLSGSLRQFRPGALAAFHLAYEHGNRAILSQVDTSTNVFRAAAAKTTTTTAPLLTQGRDTRRDEQTRPKNLDKRSSFQAKTIVHWLKKLLVIQQVPLLRGYFAY